MSELNPVVMICYNNLHLTREAVASVLAQDIPVDLWLVDNGSSDGTDAYFDSIAAPNIQTFRSSENQSPVKLANKLASTIFAGRAEYLLGVANDVVLPSNAYRELLRWPRGFVTASQDGQNPPPVREARAVSENTPMAVMLTRKWAYEALLARDGHFFDESFFHYASDCDLALRMASCGIRGVQLDLPYWHYGSASWRLASEPVQRAILTRADADRAYFVSKWGFRVDSLEYGQVASDPNWK